MHYIDTENQASKEIVKSSQSCNIDLGFQENIKHSKT